MMPGQIDQLCSLANTANRGFFNRLALAHQRNHAAVVVGVHLPVEKIDAGNFHRLDDRIDLGGIAAFREVWNTFNESGRHEKKDKSAAGLRPRAP